VVTAIARTPKPALPELPAAKGAVEPRETRRVWFLGGPRDVPVYDRRALFPGHAIEGPALVEEQASVTVLEAGHRLRIHRHGHMLIDSAE
jgi:N-methylhydantoinase A